MDRMELDPWGKRKHPDIYEHSPAASPLHPAKRSKVAHWPAQPLRFPPNPTVESDSSSSDNNNTPIHSAVPLPTHPSDQPQSPPLDEPHHQNGDGYDSPLPEPVVLFADLTVDADARIRAKDAARERERVRLGDTRRKRSDTTRSWIDGSDDEDVEATDGAESREEEEGRGEARRTRVRAKSVERPVKKSRRGVARDVEVEWAENKPGESSQDEPKEVPQGKPEETPDEKAEQPEVKQPISPRETPPPERSNNGVGGAQADGPACSPVKRPLKRSSEEVSSLDGEELPAAQEGPSRRQKRMRRRLARTDEM